MRDAAKVIRPNTLVYVTGKLNERDTQMESKSAMFIRVHGLGMNERECFLFGLELTA
jgi:hypothetical protein